jgi:hypothetical protein
LYRATLKSKLMQSMFLSGVDMEEVTASLAPIEKLSKDEESALGEGNNEGSAIASPIRDAANARLQLSSKSSREMNKLLMPKMHHAQTPDEKADIIRKFETGEIGKMIDTLKPKKSKSQSQKQLESLMATNEKASRKHLNEKMFDKNGNPMDGTVIASSLHEVTKKKLPKIVLTGKNSDAIIEELRGSDYFHEGSEASSLAKSLNNNGIIDVRNYYGLEARQRLFHHYKKMNRQHHMFTGKESETTIDDVAEHASVYSVIAAARNNVQQVADSKSIASGGSVATDRSSTKQTKDSKGSKASKVSAYSGLYLKSERRTPAHPVESTYLSRLDVFAGIDEELVKQSRSNYFSYKCLAQKVYNDDDDDDEGDSEADSNGEDEEDEEESMRDAMRSELSKILGVDASTSLLTNSQMQLLSPTQKEFWEKEQQKAMEEEAAVMCSPRTKYLGGCIREKLAPLPRLVCRANRECRAIDIADYGVGDRSKFVSFMNSSML